VSAITAFVAAFDAKVLNCTELLKSYLACGNRILTATGKPIEIATIEIFNKTHGLRIFKNHVCFFLPVLKKTNALHLYSMCGGIKTLKHSVRTTLQLAYHGCKNLTHTSKIGLRHLKRTQMVVTVRFTILKIW